MPLGYSLLQMDELQLLDDTLLSDDFLVVAAANYEVMLSAALRCVQVHVPRLRARSLACAAARLLVRGLRARARLYQLVDIVTEARERADVFPVPRCRRVVAREVAVVRAHEGLPARCDAAILALRVVNVHLSTASHACC
jgi:hypothetical protein